MEKKEIKKTQPLIFNSILVDNKITQVIISHQQKSALERMQNENSHTKVRIRLAELFGFKDIATIFKRIEKQHIKLKFLPYSLGCERYETTKIMNERIFTYYGKEAKDFALSVQ